MIKTLNAGLASLGLVATGTLAAFVTIGALEGLASVPSWLASAVGIAVFLGTLGLAGDVAAQLDPRRPYLASSLTSIVVIVFGWAAVTASEHATGEGLEFEVVVTLAAGLLLMMVTSTRLARRRQRRAGEDDEASATLDT